MRERRGLRGPGGGGLRTDQATGASDDDDVALAGVLYDHLTEGGSEGCSTLRREASVNAPR